MKKRVIISLIFSILQLFYFKIENVSALEYTEIFSNEALVVNLNNDEVLFSKNTNEESVEIASLTKIMTYVLAVENIQNLDVKITVPEGTRQNIINQNGSNAKLKDGYMYTALDLLYGLMLPSGCDAADVLAEYISNNQYDKFIEMMNKKAKELDMNNTIFYSASGLEKDGKNNLSTEQDLYKLAKYAFNLSHFRDIIKTEFYEITGTKGEIVEINTVQNTNYMIGDYNGAEYYYQYSLGGKTGNTPGAGRCLISFAKKGELSVVAITLGVPNEHSNYHLTDQKKIFEYIFEDFTENITIDIGTMYKSVGINEKIQIIPTTSEKTKITWTTSDESIATVNEYGVVTGKRLGQVKIIATTETGNQDYAYLSVGFYNGIDVKYSAGPSDSNGILGYGEIDWSIFKKYGIDFAIIRAGYALRNNPDSDPYFINNIKGAVANNLNIMISFDGYATNEKYAENEAEYLIKYLKENIPEYLDKIKLPIVYNLHNSSVTDVKVLENVIFSFQNKMKEYGYEIIVELGKTKLSTLNLELITASNIPLYIIYRPYDPNFEFKMYTTSNDINYNASIWQYRTDAYFGDKGIAKRITMSAMYMDYIQIDTSHQKFDDTMYPLKPNLEINGEYIYNGKLIETDIIGFDSNTMNIEGNIQENAGVYTINVSPKLKWNDGSDEIISLTWEIKKALPNFEIPVIEAKNGTMLKDIKLPDNFYWKNNNEIVDKTSENKFLATYIPEDEENYNSVEVLISIKLLDFSDNDLDKEDNGKDKESSENINNEVIENIVNNIFNDKLDNNDLKDETNEEPKEEEINEELKEEENIILDDVKNDIDIIETSSNKNYNVIIIIILSSIILISIVTVIYLKK